MFQKAKESKIEESTGLLFFLIQWWKPLAVIAVVTLIASAIFSGPSFITPKYKSSVIFFPAASNSLSKALLEENSSSEKNDILAFGEEEQAEQLLQILNSDEIRKTIIEKYQLMQHYNIDATSSYPMTKLNDVYENNISYHRTEYLSVRIDVLDTDAEMAANIANDIAALLDSMKTKMQHARALQGLNVVQGEYEYKKTAIAQKEDSLKLIRGKGVIDYRNQALAWNEELAKAFSIYHSENARLVELEKKYTADDTSVINARASRNGAASSVKNLEEKIKLLADYGGASLSLSEELSLEREQLNKIKARYDQMKVDAFQTVPQKFIVNKAEKSEKKYYPVRWLIVIVSLLGMLLVSIITILLWEKVRKFKTYHASH